MYILASILFLGVLTLLFDDAIDRLRNPNRTPESTINGDGDRAIILKRNRAGHYVFNGTVNGQPVEFLLDTGATVVALPAAVAQQLGLAEGAPYQAKTANGSTIAFATNIAHLQIGDLEETDVAASIIPNMEGEEILLGMSFLRRLDFQQRADTLILTERRRD